MSSAIRSWAPVKRPVGIILANARSHGKSRERVKADAIRQAVSELTEQAIDEILKSYEVKVDLASSEASPKASKVAESNE